MYAVAVLFLQTTLSLALNQYLETTIEREFGTESDLVIVGKNFDQPKRPVYTASLDQFGGKLANKKNFVIYPETMTQLETLLPKLEPLGNYIVVAEHFWAPRIFRLAQHHSIENLLLIDQHNTSMVFSTNSDGKIFGRRLRFSKDNSVLKVGYLIDTPFVIDVTGENPGVMVSMFELIQRASGISMDYTTNSSSFQHEYLTNGSFYQLTRSLIEGQIDVALGRLMLNDTPFDFGPVLYNDYLRFTGPKPKPKKSYRKLFIVFNNELWLNILYGILVMMVLFYIFSLVEDFNKTVLFDVMLNVFQIFIGCGLIALPKNISFRVLFVFFMLFSMSMDSIYLGNLSNIFASANYEMPLNNLEAIRITATKYQFGWIAERLLLLSYVCRHMPKAKHRLFITDNSQSFFINHTALAKENGTLLFKSVLEAYPSHSILLDHFRVPTDYLSLYVSFYMRKSTRYNAAVLFWAREIVEKGFVVKWFRDTALGNINTTILPEDEEKVIVLKLAHFEESFLVLVGGYAAALLALLLEFVFQQLEIIGLVQKVKATIIFLVMLLKPPERQHSKSNKPKI